MKREGGRGRVGHVAASDVVIKREEGGGLQQVGIRMSEG
jgi:hypothetical protein